MGDFILTTPAIREIRANYPNAFITLLVNKAAYPMAELCPYVNEVLSIDIDYNSFINKNKNDIANMFTIAANFASQYLWKRNYSLSICVRNGSLLLDFLLMYFSGAKERVCNINYSNSEFARYLATHAILPPKEIIHISAQNLYVLKAMGLQIRQTDLELWYDAEDLYTARKLLEGFAPNRLKVVTGIGANELSRSYPVEKYLIAFKKILKGGGSLIILGGPSEIDDAKFLEDNLPKEYVQNFVPVKTGWRVDAAITSLCDMYIGNDTGMAHISAAVHIPVIRILREAEDKLKLSFLNQRHSLYMHFFPWQDNVISINPKHALGDCKNKNAYGGCGEDKPHCITQIDPREIVDAYETFAKLIKNSGIKRTSCPPIIRNINPLPKLSSDLVHF